MPQPFPVNRPDHLAKAAVDLLDRGDGGRDVAGVADHVGVGEVDDPEAVVAGRPALAERVGGVFGAHRRLLVIRGDVAR